MRFFAAGYVVLFHFASTPVQEHGAPAPLVTFLFNGYMGVPFFFLLSGFILAYTYLGQMNSNARRRRFWEARFSRTYPVYLLSLLLNWPFRGDMSTGVKLAVLTATQTWNPLKPYLYQAWNYPVWTLSVEVFFYLSFPLLLPMLAKLPKMWQTIVMIALFAVVVFLHTSVPGDQLNPGSVGPASWVPLPVQRLPAFALGILLALRFLHRKPQGSPLRTALFLATALILLCSLHGKWLSLLVLPFAGIIYEMAAGQTALARWLSTRWMLFLGGASYSVYLLQFPVRNWVRLVCSDLLHVKNTAGALAAPALLVAVASLVFYFYEDPFRHLLKRLFAALERQYTSARV